jgi:hypothetical protein
MWVLFAFLILSVLEFPYVFFFDTMLTNIGFLYVYMWALPQATILYFVAFKLRARWTSTVLIGLIGVAGAPVEYYFEWVVQKNLITPYFAFLWIPLYVIMGLSADVSFKALRPERTPIRAAAVSAFIFTVVVIAATLFATYVFYPTPLTFDIPWIRVGWFLLPYALATGALGGYLGFCIARDCTRERALSGSETQEKS